MKIIIRTEKTIWHVNLAFMRVFPYLKLEFIGGGKKAGIYEVQVLPPSTILIEITGVLKEGIMEICPMETVSQLEYRFLYHYGIPARVLRRNKNKWVEIKNTCHLSLEKQNTLGFLSTVPAPTADIILNELNSIVRD